MNRRLYRSTEDRMLGGVCGGLAEYANIDASIMRIIALLLLFTGIGFIAYFAAWLIIPENPGYSSFNSYSDEQHSTARTINITNDARTYRFSGWALLVIGSYYLLDRICLPMHIKPYFWPVVMIAAGSYVLYKNRATQA